ncbi:MAG: hypothetical protein IVW51_10665 [Thermaceae bacterium]|nr:hypothetical protein [Thermaceae bacterium]
MLGAPLQVFGLVGLFNALQTVIDDLLIVQSVWFVAASVVLWVGARGRIRATSSV